MRLVQVNWVRHDKEKGGRDSTPIAITWHERKTIFYPRTTHSPRSWRTCTTAACSMRRWSFAPENLDARRVFNSAGGRDHWPHCFSVVLAGGGIAGGQVFGSSDKQAAFPASNPVSPQQIIATLYRSMEVASRSVLFDNEHRPHILVDAEPLHALLPGV